MCRTAGDGVLVSGLLSASLPVKVPLKAVFSLVLSDWPLATGDTVSTTVIDTVAAVLEFMPSDTVKVKLSDRSSRSSACR